MGHQVNFYLNPNDTVAVEKVLRELAPLCILHSRSSTSEPHIVDTVNIEENGQPWLYLFLIRTDDLERLVTKHIPAQGYWTVDVLKSPVVEFNRCFFDGKTLRRGRVYYVDGFYDTNDQWVQKPEPFMKWAKSILTTTKHTLKRHGSDYIGTEAEAWLASCGGKLM